MVSARAGDRAEAELCVQPEPQKIDWLRNIGQIFLSLFHTVHFDSVVDPDP
jgi:hypothetical protein